MRRLWFTQPAKEVMPRAVGYATKALKLDETLAEAHVPLGPGRSQRDPVKIVFGSIA